MAIILTAHVLGFELGLARAIGTVIFSIVIGLSMHFIFYEDEKKIKDKNMFTESNVQKEKPSRQTAFYFAILVGILIFGNWRKDESIKT